MNVDLFIRRCEMCNADFECMHPSGAWQGSNNCSKCVNEQQTLAEKAYTKENLNYDLLD